MIKMRRLCSFLLSLCITLSIWGAAFAVEPESDVVQPEGDTMPDLSGGVVTELRFERFFPKENLEIYDSIDLSQLFEMIELLNDRLDCTILLPDGTTYSDTACTALWNVEDLPLDTAGMYEVIATLVPPEGCTFAEGVRQKIVLPIQIVVQDRPVITEIASWNTYSIAVAVLQNTPLEETSVPNMFDCDPLRCYDSAGIAHKAPIEWDFSQIKTDTVGLYPVTGRVVAPEGSVFSEELVLPSPIGYVSVQAKDKPDINSIRWVRGGIAMPWVTPPGDLEAVEVWLAEEDGEWVLLKNNRSAFPSPHELLLPSLQFTYGKTYHLQVDYEGGQTGILTFLWDDELSYIKYSEGDRDGGDDNGSDFDDTEQPPPAPPEAEDEDWDSDKKDDIPESENNKPPLVVQPPVAPPTTPPLGDGGNGEAVLPPQTNTELPTAKPTVDKPKPSQPPKTKPGDSTPASGDVVLESKEETSFQEVFGKNQDIISGTRLKMMVDTTGKARFSKQGVTLTLSAAILDELNFKDKDQIAITIKKPANNMVMFSLAVNETPITNLAGSSLMVPYQAENAHANLSLFDEQNELVAQGSYNTALAVVTFTVDKTGQFTIQEQPLQKEPGTTVSAPVQPTIPAGIAAFGGTAVLLAAGIWLKLRAKA